MVRISISFVIVIIAGVSHGYFIQGDDSNKYGAQRQLLVPVPRAYNQELDIVPYYEGPQQPQPQVQQPIFLARIGRSHNFPSSPSMARADDEDYEEGLEDAGDSYAPIKKTKKNGNKNKKKDTQLSFPRRMYKKTKNAITSTTQAVFGAPKYIYTRYRDTYGFGKKKEKKVKKVKSKGQEKGWGWDDDHHDDHHEEHKEGHHEHDNNGWGWESGAGSSVDEYQRKSGGRTKNRPYRYNTYAYTQPEETRELTPLSSLNAWVQ